MRELRLLASFARDAWHGLRAFRTRAVSFRFNRRASIARSEASPSKIFVSSSSAYTRGEVIASFVSRRSAADATA